jgi:short-chain Z-isoprenyl diphosphate synthase
MHEFLRWCDDLGIRVVSLYLLSNDNLRKRDSQELDDLIEIIAELADELSHEPGWRVQIVGARRAAPDLARVLQTAQERTAGNTGLHVNLAVGYGGRGEIVDAVRSIIAKHDESGGSLEELAASLTPSRSASICTRAARPIPIS